MMGWTGDAIVRLSDDAIVRLRFANRTYTPHKMGYRYRGREAQTPSSRLSDLPRLKRLDEKFDKEPHVAGLLLVEGVDGEQGVGVGLPVGEQSD